MLVSIYACAILTVGGTQAQCQGSWLSLAVRSRPSQELVDLRGREFFLKNLITRLNWTSQIKLQINEAKSQVQSASDRLIKAISTNRCKRACGSPLAYILAANDCPAHDLRPSRSSVHVRHQINCNAYWCRTADGGGQSQDFSFGEPIYVTTVILLIIEYIYIYNIQCSQQS